MMKIFNFLIFVILATQTLSEQEIIKPILNHQILAGYEALAKDTAKLHEVTKKKCLSSKVEVKKLYNDAFDSLILVNHFRFGPAEAKQRYFALAFWPDTKARTPKILNKFLISNGSDILSLDQYQQISVAGRGFYAMEYLLYDETISKKSNKKRLCGLLTVITEDISKTAKEIFNEWTTSYSKKILIVDQGSIYSSEKEVVQELYKSLRTGLQFTADTRIGRPLGRSNKPRPKRAEAYRSSRSMRHITLALTASKDLAINLSKKDPNITELLLQNFNAAFEICNSISDPTLAGVVILKEREKLKALKKKIEEILFNIENYLGPALGVQEGFNILDGD
jgi:hypothetical protein